jgi:hypothetical protein
MLIHGELKLASLLLKKGRTPVDVILSMRKDVIQYPISVSRPEECGSLSIGLNSFPLIPGRTTDSWKKSIPSLTTPGLTNKP